MTFAASASEDSDIESEGEEEEDTTITAEPEEVTVSDQDDRNAKEEEKGEEEKGGEEEEEKEEDIEIEISDETEEIKDDTSGDKEGTDDNEQVAEEEEEDEGEEPNDGPDIDDDEDYKEEEAAETAASGDTEGEAATSDVTAPVGRKSKLFGGISAISNVSMADARRSSVTSKGAVQKVSNVPNAVAKHSITKGSNHYVNSAASFSSSSTHSGSGHSSASDKTEPHRNVSHKKKKSKKSPELMEEYSDMVTSLLEEYFGTIEDEDATFEELGLNSAKAMELTTQVAKSLRVSLPHDSLSEFCATPAIFKSYIVGRMAKDDPIPIQPRPAAVQRKMHPKYKIKWATMGILQAFLSVVLLLLAMSALLPVWYLFQYFEEVHFAMLALLIPIYFASATTVLLITKWIVIGRYRPRQVYVPSYLYLQFWFVDRLVHMWEVYVGRFLLDTVWLPWVYVLLGANISLSCNLKGFIREFDLITMGPYVTLDYHCLQARKFQSWGVSEAGPTMIFRPIVLAKECCVRGFLAPGVLVGRKAHVAKLSVVPEGGSIPDKTAAVGNPAILAGRAPKQAYYGWGLMSLLKTIFMFLDLFVFYMLAVMSALATDEMLGKATGWDNWMSFGSHICFLFVFSVSMLLSSVVVKFLFIGMRSQGRAREYLWQSFVDWAADYHFSVAIMLYQIVASHSRLSNIFLRLHGMQIDMASQVNIACFPPSIVDMIRMRRSYVWNCTFDVKKEGQFRTTQITDSSIGDGSHVAAGVHIRRAVVPPLSFVREDVDKDRMKHKNELVPSLSLYLYEIFHLCLCGLFIAIFCVTFLPAYEYLMMFAGVGMNGGIGLVVAVGAVVILSYTWALVLLFLQTIALFGASEARPRPWSQSFYNFYQSFLFTFQEYTLAWHVLFGTQLLNDCVRLLGASVNGRALLFAHSFTDFSFLTIGNKTIIDGASLSGNVSLYDDVQMAPSYTSGIVYDGSLIMGNGVVTQQRLGPLRAIVESSQGLAIRDSVRGDGMV